MGQVVTGLIPHEPPNFQTPAALALLSSPVCVVTGQRGVGKTQVAAAYARQRVRDGWLVAWIGAETEDQIKAGMVELADRLGLYRPEDSPEITAVRVRNHLQTRSGPALLVFDNVVSLDTVRPYLPSVGSTQVVITSTARGTQIGHEVAVEVFSPETALQFLNQATGLDDDLAAELAREVGHLPLALAQAAARMRATRWGYAKYLENFRKFPAEKHLSRRDGDPYPLGAATAILMALEPFQGSELVELLSVLSSEGVSRQLLDDSDDELAQLHQASLLEFAGDSSVLMHRLVQRVIRDSGRETGADQRASARAAALLSQHVRVDGEPWTYRHSGAELVRQVEALMANLTSAATGRTVERTLALRLWAANFLSETANFSRASSIANEVHAEAIARLGEDHHLLAVIRQLIAKVTSNRPQDFSELMEKDLARYREELGLEHAATLTTAVLLSRHYLELERPDEAVELLERTLEPWRDRPRDTEMVLGLVDSLGAAYTAAGRPADAIAVLEPGLQAQLPMSGADSKATLHTMSLLAVAYDAVGLSANALSFHEHVYAARRKTLGADHPVALFSADRLAEALIKEGQIDKATRLLEETHAIATEVLGADHELAVLARSTLENIAASAQTRHTGNE